MASAGVSITRPLLEPKAASSLEPKGNGLGTFMGVFLPCILSIFGAILFLRLTWAVGQAGVIGSILVFALGGLTVILTSLSVAAISTNGSMKGGGAYFMISRALGPEFGGAVGVVFFAANSVGITFYLIAFANEVDVLVRPSDGADGGTPNEWMIKLYGSAALLLMLGVSMVGAKFFTKLNLVVFVILLVSIIGTTLSFIIPHGKWDGFSGARFSKNVGFDFTKDVTSGNQMNFFSVFVVCFPAVTGIMAGANMSGDLANPGDSIGFGTLLAIVVSLAVYLLLILLAAGAFERDTLVNDVNAMQNIAFNKYLVAMGVVCSTVSSALGNLTGSGRILQALARDGLFPILNVFKWGTKDGDEPIPAILFAWFIAQCCMFIGSLNAIASIISEFFLLVYLFVNVACFALRVTGAPNFRPRFKYFSWHTALAGALLCIVILFLSSAVYAAVSIVVLILVFVYVHYKAPVSDWGDITQALLYHQVRKYLLRIDERKSHVKFWRPSVLLLVQDPSSRRYRNLFLFGNNIKKGGIYVLGSVLVGKFAQTNKLLAPLRRAWLELIDEHKLKGFPELCFGEDARTAVQNLVSSAGLGGMKPNTVIVPMYEPVDMSSVPFGELPDSAYSTANPDEESKADPRPVRLPMTDTPAAKISRLLQNFSVSPGGDEGRSSFSRASFSRGSTAEADDDSGTGVPNYVAAVRDSISLGKNVLVTRGFSQLDRDIIVEFSRHKSSMKAEVAKMRIDVWVTPESDTSENPTSALSLTMQLANVLQRTDIWAAHTALRVIAVVERPQDEPATSERLKHALDKFRFRYDLRVVAVRSGRSRPVLRALEMAGETEFSKSPDALNEVFRHHSDQSCLSFLPVSPPPQSEEDDPRWMETLHKLSQGLPPVVFVLPSGLDAVVTSDL